jgi:hypothetical protein
MTTVKVKPEGTGFAPVQVTFNRVHLATIRIGLRARQAGMFITSPSKGGGTTNLLRLLSNITGLDYPRGKNGLALAIQHCNALLDADLQQSVGK